VCSGTPFKIGLWKLHFSRKWAFQPIIVVIDPFYHFVFDHYHEAPRSILGAIRVSNQAIKQVFYKILIFFLPK